MAEADLLPYGGLAVITDALDALSWYLAWGTGTTTATRADTGLTTEGPEARVSASVSRVSLSQTNDTLRLTGSITASADREVLEMGVFTAVSGGTLFRKATLASPVSVPNGIAMGITVDTQIL